MTGKKQTDPAADSPASRLSRLRARVAAAFGKAAPAPAPALPVLPPPVSPPAGAVLPTGRKELWASFATAIVSDDRDHVLRVIAAHPDAVHWYNEAMFLGDRGIPLVTTAVCAEKYDMAKLLMAQGADINQRDGGEGTALTWVAGQGRRAQVEFLLAQGADIEARDHRGRTAEDFARECGHGDIAELLAAALARRNHCLVTDGAPETRRIPHATFRPRPRG